MNVWGDECLRWWMSEVMNVRGDECLILGRGWWMSEVMNVWGDECRGDECRTIGLFISISEVLFSFWLFCGLYFLLFVYICVISYSCNSKWWLLYLIYIFISSSFCFCGFFCLRLLLAIGITPSTALWIHLLFLFPSIFVFVFVASVFSLYLYFYTFISDQLFGHHAIILTQRGLQTCLRSPKTAKHIFLFLAIMYFEKSHTILECMTSSCEEKLSQKDLHFHRMPNILGSSGSFLCRVNLSLAGASFHAVLKAVWEWNIIIYYSGREI